MNSTRTLSLYFAFSFIAAVLVIFLVGISPSHPAPIFFQEKVGIVCIFCTCCCVGISFTIRPNWVRRYFPKFMNERSKMQSQENQSFQGHHPDCSTFQEHTIRWNEKTWCAGCLGLFIGLCVSIFLMIFYMAINFHPTKMMALLLLLLGLLIVLVVYGEIRYRSRYTIVHVFLNSLLPLSFFVITVIVEEITGEFIYSFFTILLCFLWLDTRIQLSKWRHRLICAHCVESCKMFTVSG